VSSNLTFGTINGPELLIEADRSEGGLTILRGVSRLAILTMLGAIAGGHLEGLGPHVGQRPERHDRGRPTVTGAGELEPIKERLPRRLHVMACEDNVEKGRGRSCETGRSRALGPNR
jgi:hypothetical protein